MNNVLICGSRTFGNFAKSLERLKDRKLAREEYERDWYFFNSRVGFYLQHRLHEGVQIVHGGANGADHLADRYAREILKQEPLVFPADWSKGKGAGFRRNSQMVDVSQFVIAFWDGKSRGTKDSIDKAYASDTVMDVKVVRFDLYVR